MGNELFNWCFITRALPLSKTNGTGECKGFLAGALLRGLERNRKRVHPDEKQFETSYWGHRGEKEKETAVRRTKIGMEGHFARQEPN